MTSRVASTVGLRLQCSTQLHVGLIICVTKLALCATTVSRIMRGHVMAPPFPLPNRAADVRPGCKTQRIAPTLRQDGNRGRLGVLSLKETRIFPNTYCWTHDLLLPV
ncbi:hypothetical protein PoB_004065000 [Plakobranchus ocellatus]|uniref:Secreted protein n=1 Tax=Plakobranchus ocellatus TaxID=259542 RepID=A0AAV4B507_9GAST|nr:hypothetical protein PoB_004065000 [Plakobranchus ocellatus]